MSLVPRLKVRNQSVKMPALTGSLIIVIVLFYSNFINIANYSFLSYNFHGVSISNSLFAILRYSRLPVLFIGILIVVYSFLKNRTFESFCVANLDVVLFSLALYLGLYNAIDLINGTLYTVWQTFSLIGILLLIYSFKNKFDKIYNQRLFFQFLFWSNFIVLPLLLLNIPTIGEKWSYHMAYSDKTFYPYCALSMIISIYMSNILTGKSLFNWKTNINTVIEIAIVVSLLFFVFLSARRTPLFILFYISFFYLFFAIGKRMWKKVGLVIGIVLFSIYSIPKLLQYMEVHKYELSVLKKIDDVIQTGGELKKDASYNERLIIWDSYLNIFKAHPLVGVGAYNSVPYHSEHLKGQKLSHHSTHNLYLGILVEHGILGLALFVLIIFRSIILGIRNLGIRKTVLWGFYMLIPVLIINWAEYNLIPGQVFYWTTFLVILFPRMA